MVKRVIDGAVAASGASETIDTGSGATVNVQVCGDEFTGQVVFKQGADPDWLMTTKTLDLDGLDDGSEYYTLDRSTYTRIEFTRTAGALTVFVEVLE